MPQFSFILIFVVGLSSAIAQDLTRPRPRLRQSPVRPKPVTQISEKNSWDKVESWSFQFGTHTEFYDAVQVDSAGTQRKIAFSPTLGIGMKFVLAPSWTLLPELNWVLPWEVGSSNEIRNLFMIRGDVGYDLLDWLRLRVGTSLMWLNMHGKGGTTKISNGNSQSTFYNPDENRSALNNTFDLGAEAFFSDDWSTRLQTYTYSIFQEERRQISYTLFLTYHWK